MKLIFLVQRNRWYIEDSEIWYPIQTAEHRTLAQSVLPMICIDEFEMADQPLQGASAEVCHRSEAAVSICLKSKSGEIVVEKMLELESSLLAIVDWKASPYPDSWVESRTQLELEHVSKLELHVFLPEIAGSTKKTLEVSDTDGNSQKHTLVRGEQTLCTLVDKDSPGDYNFFISCEPEPCPDTSDVRSLGFVLANTVVTV